MTMKKIRNIVSVLVLLLIVFSCAKKDSSLENDLKYKVVLFEKQSEGCDSLRDDFCAKIKIEFPQITNYDNSAVMDKINQSIQSLFSTNENANMDSINFDNEMNSFIEDYQEFITEFPDSYQAWFIERTGEVRLNKENIFSIDYMEYSYTGGAHPNVSFKNFNLNNGERLN